jgi:hypothetical protein
MGFELELKLNFIGLGKWAGIECATEFTDLCDDGSDPEIKLYVTKEKSKD